MVVKANYKMRQLLILILFVIHLTASGQHDIGMKANGGLSYLDTKFHSNETVDKIYFQPSGQGGLFYNFNLHDKFLIGTEILFIQIEGKEYFEVPETDNIGNPTGLVWSDNIWRHISYLGVPIYFGYNFKKLNVNLGFQTNFTIASSGREKGQAPFNGDVVTWENKANKLGIDNYDYGLRAGVFFKLTDKFSIETNYYYGLNNILKYKIGSWKWTVQQMTVGLHYKLFSICRQPSETNK